MAQMIQQGPGLQGLIAEIESSLSVLGPAGVNSRGRDEQLTKQLHYQRQIHRMRGVLRAALPPDGSPAIVVSRGDDELLYLDGRPGWHFPQMDDGTYAGHHPGSGAQAIERLEQLRQRGARFLVFPSTAFWWLEHYTDFRQHIEERYPVVVREEDTCLVFALGQGGD